MKKKSLKWGETPWDYMSLPALLREVQRMYSALQQLYCAMRIIAVNSDSGYFGNQGTGGKAMEMGRQILEPLHAQYLGGSEDLFRAFYRYANDLLFDRSKGFSIGFGWAVCPICGTMLGENAKGESSIGKACADKWPARSECEGIFRALEWEDLDKKWEKAGLRTPQLTFENVLWNGEDQVIVKKILKELVPPDIQKLVVKRFGEEVLKKLESED